MKNFRSAIFQDDYLLFNSAIKDTIYLIDLSPGPFECRSVIL